MGKTARTKDGRQGAATQVLLPVLGVLVAMRDALMDLVIGSGLDVLRALLEQERTALCGPRYEHQAERRATRAGYAQGELVLGGRRVAIRRPRVRSTDGKEVPLPSWEKFSAEDPLTARALEQMLVGVTTRKYARSLEPVPAEVKTRGTSKSAVSRRFGDATAAALEQMMSKSLAGLEFAALMLDGIVCGAHTVLIALGIDATGKKHVLGLWEGATENATACKSLLSSLVDRGLRTDRSLLVVIDGSKALSKAVRDVFGKRALIQRCQVHKKRNVLEHLPERERDSIGAAISSAYRCRDPKRALRLLTDIARRLERKHPGAAASLREGLEETLTVLYFGLSDALERTLATTNPIENVNCTARRVSRNVKRWQDGSMALRWMAAAIGEAEKGFRRLRGYEAMPKLLKALRAHDEKLEGGIAPVKEAA